MEIGCRRLLGVLHGNGDDVREHSNAIEVFGCCGVGWRGGGRDAEGDLSEDGDGRERDGKLRVVKSTGLK